MAVTEKTLIPVELLHGRIIFSSDREERYATKTRIYMVNADRSGFSVLCTPSLSSHDDEVIITYNYPHWFPDGEKILYLQNEYSAKFGHKTSYHVKNIQTDDDDVEIFAIQDTSVSLGPMALSSDGTIILAKILSLWAPRPMILIKNIFGTKQYDTIASVGHFYNPRWSPDGGKVLFFGFSGHGYNINHDIFTVDTNGMNLQNLTNHPARDADPAYSPDGTQIAFISSRNGLSHVYIMDADGSNVRQITSGRFDCTSPAWSPDGKFIAYCRSSVSIFQGHEIWVTTVDSTMERQITRRVRVSDHREKNEKEKHKKWSDDGSLDWH